MSTNEADGKWFGTGAVGQSVSGASGFRAGENKPRFRFPDIQCTPQIIAAGDAHGRRRRRRRLAIHLSTLSTPRRFHGPAADRRRDPAVTPECGWSTPPRRRPLPLSVADRGNVTSYSTSRRTRLRRHFPTMHTGHRCSDYTSLRTLASDYECISLRACLRLFIHCYLFTLILPSK